MKFVITGSLGNISKPLTRIVTEAGHDVTVISGQPERAAAIAAIGAQPAIGSLNDVAFLTETFRGADAVYLMVPPSFTVTDYRAYYHRAAADYTAAIKASGVTRIVTLSSIGAHLAGGTGPIKGLHDLEQAFDQLEGVSVKYLRPAYFYTNFYGNIAMIKEAGILGGNYPASAPLVMVHPEDIAETAAYWLQQSFTGHSITYVASDEMTAGEATALLGEAIGKPDLPWVAFTDEQAYEGMLQSGLSEELARNYTEMGAATRSGILWEDYLKNKPELSSRKFRDFARDFARAF